MNDPMVLAAALVLVIGAITTATVTVMAAFGKMKTEMLAKVSSVQRQADDIHTLVNGSAHLAAERLAALENRIVDLHSTVAALQELRVSDAQQKGAS